MVSMASPLPLLITLTWHVSLAVQNTETSTLNFQDYSSTSPSATSSPFTVTLSADPHVSLPQNEEQASTSEEIKHRRHWGHIVDLADRAIVTNTDPVQQIHNKGQYRFAEYPSKNHYERKRRWSNFASWGKKRSADDIGNDDETSVLEKLKNELSLGDSGDNGGGVNRYVMDTDNIDRQDGDMMLTPIPAWEKQLGDKNRYQSWKLMTLLLDKYQEKQLKDKLKNVLFGGNSGQPASKPLQVDGQNKVIAQLPQWKYRPRQMLEIPILNNKYKSGGYNSQKRWKQMSVWGKRDPDDIQSEDKRWKQMSVWGKRDPDDIQSDDKRWKQMSVWGKRYPDASQSENKRWKQMSVWGKRDGTQKEDKRWKQMSVWGKRGGSQEEAKRWKQMSVLDNGVRSQDEDKRWKQMSLWGKRYDNEGLDKRWNQMAVWGKRETDDDLGKMLRQTSTRVKRNTDKKWKQMSVWGKRNDDQDLSKRWAAVSAWGKRDDIDQSNHFNKEKIMQADKKWKQMAVWGKRDVADLINKRWKTMGLWGKRSGHSDVNSYNEKRWKNMSGWGKRFPEMVEPMPRMGKRSSINSPWGKRTFGNIRNWRGIKMWNRKRPSWSRTGFTSWGKRSGEDNIRLLHGHILDNQSVLGATGSEKSD